MFWTACQNELYSYAEGASAAVLVSDINSGSADSNPTDLCVIGSRLVFAATTAATGTELWVSDGTSGGTTLLKDIEPGTGSSQPRGMTYIPVLGAIYFQAIEVGRTNVRPRAVVLYAADCLLFVVCVISD